MNATMKPAMATPASIRKLNATSENVDQFVVPVERPLIGNARSRPTAAPQSATIALSSTTVPMTVRRLNPSARNVASSRRRGAMAENIVLDVPRIAPRIMKTVTMKTRTLIPIRPLPSVCAL